MQVWYLGLPELRTVPPHGPDPEVLLMRDERTSLSKRSRLYRAGTLGARAGPDAWESARLLAKEEKLGLNGSGTQTMGWNRGGAPRGLGAVSEGWWVRKPE